jgi:murein DD-endopeptidase MepM/ murein hydrolase activator NlpD
MGELTSKYGNMDGEKLVGYNLGMRVWKIVSALMVVSFLAACNKGAAGEMDDGGNLHVDRVSTAVPTNTPVPTATHTSLPTPTAAPTSTITPTSEPIFELCSPLPLHPLEVLEEIIGDPYDPPPPGREERHHGVDLAYYHWEDRDTMEGEPVQAVLGGVVAARMEDRMPYGNMVMIATPQSELPDTLVALLDIPEGESLYLLYAHFREPPEVELGEKVTACQSLGEVGMTGWTEVPHLHLEARKGPAGTEFQSILYYDTQATQEEMDNYVLWRTSGVFQHFDPMTLLLAYQDE